MKNSLVKCTFLIESLSSTYQISLKVVFRFTGVRISEVQISVIQPSGLVKGFVLLLWHDML